MLRYSIEYIKNELKIQSINVINVITPRSYFNIIIMIYLYIFIHKKIYILYKLYLIFGKNWIFKKFIFNIIYLID